MASIQTGVAVIYGFSPIGTVTTTTATAAGTVTGIASMFRDSGDLSNDIKVDEIRDEDNELVGCIHSGETFEFSLMFTPKGTTLTGATSAANALSPPIKGSAVLLTSFVDDSAAPFINGAYLYVGGWKVSFKKDGVATYEMKIRRGSTVAANSAAAGIQLAIL